MREQEFDADTAQAIIQGRLLRLPTLRAMAEFGGGILDDSLWRSMEPKWKWHDAMSSEDLQRRIGTSSPS